MKLAGFASTMPALVYDLQFLNQVATYPDFMIAFVQGIGTMSDQKLLACKSTLESQHADLSSQLKSSQWKVYDLEDRLSSVTSFRDRLQTRLDDAEAIRERLHNMDHCRHCGTDVCLHIWTKGNGYWDLRCGKCRTRL